MRLSWSEIRLENDRKYRRQCFKVVGKTLLEYLLVLAGLVFAGGMLAILFYNLIV